MASHIDPMDGDCEEIRAPCPWSQIGCPESKVRVGNKQYKKCERFKFSSIFKNLLRFRTPLMINIERWSSV